ncbi:hypothetical protein NMG60_11020557 [Bertholletia excelsa]
MAELTEELEPLFDYSRVQPFDVVCLDDDFSDSSPAMAPKGKKLFDIEVEMVDKNVKVMQVINSEDEDDWLPPPPKVSYDAKNFDEDSTIMELRLRKQELASLAKSAEEVLQLLEQSMKRDFNTSLQPIKESFSDQRTKLSSERAKIVVSIQDKEGLKQFRVYKDDKFEPLFKMYADRSKLDLQKLVFCFDGDKINPTAHPEALGMEDDDIIEVHIKSN